MEELIVDQRFKSNVIFERINRQFITLKDADMSICSSHLKTVLETILAEMEMKDTLFKACYRKIAYVGSYYEGLKVGSPEEFDLNIILNLPIDYNELKILIAPEKAGFIKIKADPSVLTKLRKHPRWYEYRLLDKWFDESTMCIDQNKFRQWFESVVTRALHSFNYSGDKYLLKNNGQQYTLRHKKSGPALTLIIDAPDGRSMDVDLVPALEFTNPPPKPFRSHTKNNEWFAISKPLNGVPNNKLLWRPSFYVREQDLLKGSIKPVIRQMKKLRDTQNFKSIASYYIKTLFLLELEKRNYKPEFQKLSSTFLFYHMLQELQKACENHMIRDFWNTKNNLLSNIHANEMSNISSRLKNIVQNIDKKIASDPYIIAKYILTSDEFDQL